MKKIDPIMFSQAMYHGIDLGRKLRNLPSARMAKALDTKNSVDP